MTIALTRREIEVLVRLARGKNARQVGGALGMGKRKVLAHTQSAARKLDAVNTTHAIAIAIRDHLIES